MPELTLESLRFISLILFGLAIGLMVITGWGRRATIGSWENAAHRFKQDYPALHAVSGVVSNSTDTALLELSDGSRPFLGAVAVFGDKYFTRLIDPQQFKIRRAGDQLVISTSDLTTRKIKLPLNAQDADHWQAYWHGLGGA